MVDRFGGTAVITVFILSLLVVTIIAWWTAARRRHRTAQARFDNLPLLAVPAAPGHIARPSYGGAEMPHPTSVLAPSSAPAVGYDSAPSYAARHVASPSVETGDREAATWSRPAPSLSTAADDDVGQAIDGASVRYWRAADGTLQFLPGRLELAAGRDAGQEIRFVRTAGPDGTTVTFGRAEGAPYRHVQLREPTVSRSHARMSLESTPGSAHPAHWRLENLSATNPVVVNGRALAADAGAKSSVILSDGDRIEMGEVAFLFRAR
jgi:hypothetical protein